MTEFKVLGTLEVVHEGQVCTPSPPRVRTVLALLLLRANQVVHVDSLIEELWDLESPQSAVTTVQTYIYQLRKIFAAGNLEQPGRELLVTKPPGYMFRLEPDQLDADTFRKLSCHGQMLLESGRPDQASEVLRQALEMWTGPALANVTLGRLLRSHAVHLEERRIRALELRIQADVELNRHRELIGELRSLVAIHPLNEWFHAQLIAALSRSGRRSEALQAYQELRTVLNEELGLDPSPELQSLQREVLTSGAPSPVTLGTRGNLTPSTVGGPGPGARTGGGRTPAPRAAGIITATS